MNFLSGSIRNGNVFLFKKRISTKEHLLVNVEKPYLCIESCQNELESFSNVFSLSFHSYHC